jgi:uncharacterized protein YbdZ (MbtH family)
MTNPFENEQGTYVVLMNEEGQYSLWPAFVHIPAGWEIVCGETSRSGCIRLYQLELDRSLAEQLEAGCRSSRRSAMKRRPFNQRTVVSIVYVTAMFMAAMDASVINMALPAIMNEFKLCRLLQAQLTSDT